MKDINSHIQMPKFVLKEFVDNNKFLYCYHFPEKVIKKGHPETVNTEKGYYSQKVEDYLNRNIETEFSKIVQVIKKLDSIPVSFEVPAGGSDAVRNYVYSLLSRSRGMVTETEKHSRVFSWLRPQGKHDYSAVSGVEIARAIDLFGDYFVTYVVNSSDTPFILPLCGVYVLADGYMCAPITPKHAVLLVHNKHGRSFFGNGRTKVVSISKGSEICCLNKKAIEEERDRNCRGVVSNNRELLRNLLESVGIDVANVRNKGI